LTFSIRNSVQEDVHLCRHCNWAKGELADISRCNCGRCVGNHRLPKEIPALAPLTTEPAGKPRESNSHGSRSIRPFPGCSRCDTLGITMRITKLILTFSLILAVAGCSWLPDKIDETKNWSANKIYTEAKSAADGGDYETAIKYYELLEARYPFGRYAQQAQMEVAYAYYKYDEPESAIAAADRFIKLHPRHPNVDYAYYLKGLVNFNRNTGFLQRLIPQNLSTRDPGSLRQAFLDFSELVKKFPDSKYAADAKMRMMYLRNSLAMHEINVAQYYMKRKAYVAVANRAKYVVEHYDGSTAMPDALALMATAYEKLGMTQLASDARRVLAMNFPQAPALAQLERGGNK
jgi:outer membrane protein assembly factor BamD